MRATDESRLPVVRYARTAMRLPTAHPLSLCLLAGLTAFGLTAHPAVASAPLTLSSGLNETRTTIPVTIDGQRASCVLDTGSSVMLVSPALAHAAGLRGDAGTFEVAPDGRSYADRQTQIARLEAGSYTMQNVRALISSNLTGYNALCGYDFFTHFPLLIDRAHRSVTLFPDPKAIAHLHCLPVNLSPHVPLATVEVNGTWLNQIVLDSGMAGGGALWENLRARLRQPLVADANYLTTRSAIADGFSCGASAWVRFASNMPASSMPICTERQRPDGYNGILETNLPGVHAMAVDYAHRRICFDVVAFSQPWAAAKAPALRSNAWSRFNALRSPP
jgi:Aspartyl protease